MRSLSSLATVLLFLGLVPNAMAQQTATVTGTVADPSGALIPGVQITATNNNTGISTSRLSGEAGSYAIPALQPGAYTIVASLPGFADRTIQVNLTPNQTYRFNFALQLEAEATVVEVVSDADALLAQTSASVGDVLPIDEVEALPLATRDVFDLLEGQAGLIRSADGDATNFAGTRVSMVNTTRDGVVVSDGRYLDWNGAFAATFTSPDLVEEVQISIGTVDSTAGRGSAQVALQTRSGTNEYHGALFYSSNNSAFNANNWFDNAAGRPQDWTNRQQFGGRIGGPIIENKAFFFVLIDEQRYRTRNNIVGEVLTAQARQGLFRYWPGVENDNATAGAGASVDFNGNPTMPAGATGPLQTFNLFSDVNDPNRGTGISSNSYIQETLARMPMPNDFTVGDGLNTAGYSWVRRQSGIDNAAGTSQDTNRDNLNVRLDYTITESNRVNFVMSREHNFNQDAQPTWPDGLVGESTRDPRIYTAQYTATVTPTIVNEFRFGYRQTSWHGRPPWALGCCFGDDEAPFDNLTPEGEEAAAFFEFSNGYPYLPALSSLDGNLWMTVPNDTAQRSQVSPLWQFGDTVSWVMGSHSFSAGWEGTWADSDGWNTGGMWSRVSLGDGENPVQGIQGAFPGLQNADANTAEDILNDLSGSVDELLQAFIVNDPAVGFVDIQTSVKQSLNFHQDDWGAFVKDTFNVTPNLTLNYGLRWDVYGVPYDAKGLNVKAVDNNFIGISADPNDPVGPLTEFVPVGKGSPNPDLRTYDKDWNNFAPSFGFSYRVPWMDRPTVVRGGYGISYSGAATFLQYDFGVGRQQGKSFDADTTPLAYTAVPGSTNPAAADVQFPLLTLDNGNLTDPTDPTFLFEPFGTVGLDSSIRASQTLYAYADDRRTPYIQNFNLSIETEIARDTNFSVTYVGTRGVSLWGGRQVNEPNIYASSGGQSILDAFILTREGGDAALFDQIFAGLDFSGQDGGAICGVGNPCVVGTDLSASSALRRWTTTDDWFADGEVAALAEYLTETNALTGSYGGLLRNGNLPENFIKVNPQFNQVDLYDNSDDSVYHSLQLQVTKRLSQGFSGRFSYTWSKALGNAATATFRAREDQSFATRDPQNKALQWGVVPFHRTHQFNAHGVWNLPFGPGQLVGGNTSGAVARIIEGWDLATVFGWTSGQPLSILTGGGAFGSGGLNTLVGEDVFNTPDLIGGVDAFPRNAGEVVVSTGSDVQYLTGFNRVPEPVTDYYGTNPDALQAHDALWQIEDANGNVVLRNPKPGTTGNLSGLWLEGPGRLRLDAALSKSVQVHEGWEFTVRVDAINVLNTPQWDNPNTNINSVNFGRIDDSSGERTFTINARVDF